MATSARQHALGAYTYDQVVTIAEQDFPDAFSATLKVEDVPWKLPKYRVGFSEHCLFLGYITISNITNKVSAQLSTSGDICLFRREVGLSRRENEKIEFAGFWAHLTKRAERPNLDNLKALCGFYFVAGVDEVKVARILQRLLIVVKTKQRKWGDRVEEELKWAWRDYRRYWR